MPALARPNVFAAHARQLGSTLPVFPAISSPCNGRRVTRCAAKRQSARDARKARSLFANRIAPACDFVRASYSTQFALKMA